MRRSRLGLALLGSLALAACQGTTNEILSLRENAPLPKDALAIMRAKGMTPSSPIMIRIFKEENVLEVWKQQDSGRFELVKSYEICKYSGEKGPKYKEGDRQAPEGFYYVGRAQMNPRSNYHLSFNLGFPNAYDRSHGRTGTHLMVHGDCSSAGCYAMTDEGIAEIYAFAREALNGGKQTQFLVKAYPFRMTAENMARHRDHQHFEYWTMIKEGYDHFELTKQPPKVDACEQRYVFNQHSESRFIASAQCPADMKMPDSLAAAYQAQQVTYQAEFEKAVAALEKEQQVKEAKAIAAAAADAEKAAAAAAQAAEETETIVPVAEQPTVVDASLTAPTPQAQPAVAEASDFPPSPTPLPVPVARQ